MSRDADLVEGPRDRSCSEDRCGEEAQQREWSLAHFRKWLRVAVLIAMVAGGDGSRRWPGSGSISNIMSACFAPAGPTIWPPQEQSASFSPQLRDPESGGNAVRMRNVPRETPRSGLSLGMLTASSSTAQVADSAPDGVLAVSNGRKKALPDRLAPYTATSLCRYRIPLQQSRASHARSAKWRTAPCELLVAPSTSLCHPILVLEDNFHACPFKAAPRKNRKMFRTKRGIFNPRMPSPHPSPGLSFCRSIRLGHILVIFGGRSCASS